MKTIIFRTSTELHKALTAAAKAENRSVANYLNHFLESLLKAAKENNKEAVK